MIVSKFFLFALGIFFVFCSCEQHSTGWRGTIEKEDGVTVVKNPREPVYKTEKAFFLEEELSIGEVSGREEYMFSEVHAIATDDKEKIYVLDPGEYNIKIYDQNGVFIKKFGRTGQGPGEIFSPMNMIITIQNEIMIKNSNNISFYSLDGEFKRSMSTATLDLAETQIDDDGNIIGLAVVRDIENPRYELKKFKPDLNYLFSLGSSPLPILPLDGFNPFLPVLKWDVINGNQVVCGYMKEYEMKIFDVQGRLIRKIMKEYVPIKVTQEDVDEKFEKEELFARFEARLRERMNVPEFHSPFQNIVADDEGNIFVETNERFPPEEGYFYDIFDTEGRFIIKVPLKNCPLLIKKEKLFAVEEDDDGYQFVKRFKMIWSVDKEILNERGSRSKHDLRMDR